MEKIIQRLTAVAGKNLLALYVQESLRNEVLILVLKDADFFKLEKMRPILRRRNFVILSEEDLKEGRDVFPVEFLRFKVNAELLEGKDVLKTVKIQKNFLRPHLEYELRNKRMFLRMEYLKVKKGRDFLPFIMPTFESFTDSLLYLKSSKNLETLELDEKLELIEEKYDIDLAALFQLLVCEEKAISRRLDDHEITAMIEAVDTILHQLIDKVNNL